MSSDAVRPVRCISSSTKRASSSGREAAITLAKAAVHFRSHSVSAHFPFEDRAKLTADAGCVAVRLGPQPVEKVWVQVSAELDSVFRAHVRCPILLNVTIAKAITARNLYLVAHNITEMLGDIEGTDFRMTFNLASALSQSQYIWPRLSAEGDFSSGRFTQ